jgi:Transposase Tn5 dimerisation domain/Transposase DNA-binding
MDNMGIIDNVVLVGKIENNDYPGLAWHGAQAGKSDPQTFPQGDTMQEWIDKELATAQFGTVKTSTAQKRKPKKPRKSKSGNVKLKKRFQKVLDSMSSKPSLKFPAGCKGDAETKAAYRFLDNEHVTFPVILKPHHDATLARIREQAVVLIPQDTTELDLTRPHEIMAGAGPLNDVARVGFYNHVNLAMTPEHLILGVVDAALWARDFEGFDKDADQKRAERRAKPIEDKESFRWLEGYRAACRVAQAAPETLIVSMADSEGDVYEYILEAQTVTEVRKASFIIRACQNRAVVTPEEAASSEEIKLLRERTASTPVLAQLTLKIRARDGQATDDRKRKQPRAARTAEVDVHATRVTLRGPSRPGGKLPDVEVNAVLVTEPNPPAGAEPIEWLLLTDLPIDTVENVLCIVDYYACRWQIEIYFRILKSGCKVEESQLEKAERFEPYLALNLIVAWRVMHVMMLGRECPDLPCDIAWNEDEWRSVYATVTQQAPPAEPPTMQTMVRLIGSLGGWLGRKCDGEPGPKAMWVGMQRMTDLALGWRAHADHRGAPVADRVGSVRRRE